jgi:phage terminase large subunit-like protein
MMTRGEKVIAFIEKFCLIPEGKFVGKPMLLDDFQKKFILEVYDNPAGTRRAYLSIARKNGKSGLIAGLLLAHIAGPEAVQNSQIISGARSRDQAALVFNLAAKSISLSPILSDLVKIVPSGKKLIGLRKNVEYRALAADGTTAHGLSPVLAILDEVGQVKGPQDDFIDAITTSQGAHDAPLLVAISTQAPSDADLLSIWLDDAARSNDPKIVSHVYAAPDDCDLQDEAGWLAANPAMNSFRSKEDLVEQAKQASRMPSSEAAFRNLCLNQRISLESLWLSPNLWKENSGQPDLELFKTREVHLGLDLSKTDDLTAAVAAVVDDDGIVHVIPWVFSPMATLEDRAKRDRAPYDQWTKMGKMIAVPGKTLDYEWVSEFLGREMAEMNLATINFDRWRIEDFKRDAQRVGFGLECQWLEIGQGYQSMSPRLERMNELLLHGKVRHGGHPLLNMAAANAIVVSDPSGNMKLDKSQSTQKIDPLQAMVMAVYAAASVESEVDISSWIA